MLVGGWRRLSWLQSRCVAADVAAVFDPSLGIFKYVPQRRVEAGRGVVAGWFFSPLRVALRSIGLLLVSQRDVYAD